MLPNEEVYTRVTIEPSGKIEYSKGLVVLASCNMNLREFPLDTQLCFLKFGSYSSSMEDIIYEWQPGKTEVVVQHSEMAQFEYKGSKLKSSIDEYDAVPFSTIEVTFFFHRRIGYFLIQVYFPDIFVVIISWMVFWMEKANFENRMALGVTTILTIMFLLGSLNGNLPKVSYPKALDWYLLVSVSFVFLSLIECLAVFLCMTRASQCQEKRNQAYDICLSTRISSSVNIANGSRNTVNTPPSDCHSGENQNIESDNKHGTVYRKNSDTKTELRESSRHNPKKAYEKMADMIDKGSRVLFPLAFIVFNIFYWSYYNNIQ